MNPRLFLPATIVASAFLAAPAASAMGGSPGVVPSGKIAMETRAVSGFTGIRLKVPGTVVLRQAETQSVSIEADDNLLPEIATVVERGSLEIRFRSRMNVVRRPTIRLLVTGPAFDSLAIAGGGEIITEALKSNALSISISGAGDVKIARLEAGTLAAAIAGSGDVKVAGRADEVTVKIAGSGDVVARSLDAKRATVSISGSGDAALLVRDTLSVSIAGSGDVRYHGDPAVTRKIAGSGSVTRLGPAP